MKELPKMTNSNHLAVYLAIQDCDSPPGMMQAFLLGEVLEVVDAIVEGRVELREKSA